MKKRCQKLIYVAVIVGLMLVFSACRDENKELLGEWIYLEYMGLEEIGVIGISFYFTEDDMTYSVVGLEDFEEAFDFSDLFEGSESYHISEDGQALFIDEEYTPFRIEGNILYLDDSTFEMQLFRAGSPEYEARRAELEAESAVEQGVTTETASSDDEDETEVEEEEEIIPFLGVWDYGFGNHLTLLNVSRRIEFLADGTVIYWTTSTHDRESTWELNEDGEIVIEGFSLDDDVFGFERAGDQLTLNDASGNRRTWQREGTRESREHLSFLGVWEYGHGHRLEHPDPEIRRHRQNRPQGIRISEDQLFFLDNQSEEGSSTGFFWDLDEHNRLMLDNQGAFGTFKVEVIGDVLVITDENGNTGTWFEEGVDFEDHQAWIITDYLDLFEVDKGYRIVRNREITGDQFDFVIYDLESTEAREGSWWRVNDWYFIVVMKQGDEVLEVIRHEVTGPSVTIDDVVIEVDLTFNGQQDVLLFSGYHYGVATGNQYSPSFRHYEMFLQREDGLEHIPSFANICSPHLDVENRRLMASGRRVRATWGIHEGRSGGCTTGSRVYAFMNQEWNMVGELIIEPWGAHRERLLIGDRWQERELCVRIGHEDEENVFCEGYGQDDFILYERIFGEHPYWHLRHFHGAPPSWHEE